jgi:hypothetical protein
LAATKYFPEGSTPKWQGNVPAVETLFINTNFLDGKKRKKSYFMIGCSSSISIFIPIWFNTESNYVSTAIEFISFLSGEQKRFVGVQSQPCGVPYAHVGSSLVLLINIVNVRFEILAKM